jgi:hypothetical protein
VVEYMSILNRTYDSLGSWVSRLKYPLLVILAAGLIVRFLLLPMTFNDTYYWFLTSENIMSGIGLYSREGFYYSPPFGYVLGLSTAIGSFLLGVPAFATQVDALNVLETYYPYKSVVVTFGYAVAYKIPLIIGDIMMSYAVYWFVKDRTGDKKKAIVAFMLCFLCPLVIFESSVHGMMDIYSALMAFLSLIFISKGRYFLGGLTWSTAVFIKIFPGLLLPIFIAFIIRKHKGDIKAILVRIGYAAAGCVCSLLLIYYPMLLDGTFVRSWDFLFSRVSNAGALVSGSGDAMRLLDNLGFFVGILVQIIALILAVYLAYRYCKQKEEDKNDHKFFLYALLSLAFAFLWVPMPQYLVLLIPFIAFYAVMFDRRYITPWLFISVGAVVFIVMVEGPLSLFQTLATSTGLINIDGLASALVSYVSGPRSEPYALTQIIPAAVGAATQLFGVVLLFIYRHKKYRREPYEV